MKSRRTIYILIGVVLLCIVAAIFIMMQKSSAPNGGQPMLPTQTITVSGQSVVAELATTATEREDGLSGRTGLQNGAGMLFVFPTDSKWGFWMKDMSFSIDIIWADSSGKIIAVDSSVSPQTYPNVFYPGGVARYVLELPAGYANAHNITAGDAITFTGLPPTGN